MTLQNTMICLHNSELWVVLDTVELPWCPWRDFLLLCVILFVQRANWDDSIESVFPYTIVVTKEEFIRIGGVEVQGIVAWKQNKDIRSGFFI